MHSRTIGIIVFALGLVVAEVAYSPPAQAIPTEPIFVEYDLTISFIPGNPVFTDLTGAASFTVPFSFGETTINFVIGGFDIGTLIPGNPVVPGNPVIPGNPIFTGRFIPSDPIIPGNPVSPVSFSFGGHSGIFPAFAFPDGVTLGTLSSIAGPPIMPLPIFDQQGPPIRVSGLIVGFDDPEAIGTWDITIQAATPLPGALPLFASGLGALGLFGWRRKRKAAARAA